jgi:hypothetical protein
MFLSRGGVIAPKKTCFSFEKAGLIRRCKLQHLDFRFDNPSSRSGQVALRHPVPRILPFRWYYSIFDFSVLTMSGLILYVNS